MASEVDEHADQYRPLGAYLALTAAFNGLLGWYLAAAGRRGRLPARYAPGDLLLFAIATAKLSRLVTRDRVTAGLRAPFTRFQGDAGQGEVDEAARGRGLRLAIGELVVCEFCMAQWIAAGFVAGLAAAPRTTRAVGAVFTVFGLSDVAQIARERLH